MSTEKVIAKEDARIQFRIQIFWSLVDSCGRATFDFFAYTLSWVLMFYISIRSAVTYRAQSFRSLVSVVLTQIYFTGWQAMTLITILGLATGSVVILQSASRLSLLGSGEMIGQLMVMIIVREIAPLLTALIVIARSGTAVASEIGNMKYNREIEGLESMGINPLSYIVFPRLIGGTVSVLCLAFYFAIIAVLGGFFFTKMFHSLSTDFYFGSLAQAFTVSDSILFLAKNIVGGIVIFSVCCYQGFQVQNGSHEVPQVTTKAVMNSLIYVVIFHLVLTILFYLNELKTLGVL